MGRRVRACYEEVDEEDVEYGPHDDEDGVGGVCCHILNVALPNGLPSPAQEKGMGGGGRHEEGGDSEGGRRGGGKEPQNRSLLNRR